MDHLKKQYIGDPLYPFFILFLYYLVGEKELCCWDFVSHIFSWCYLFKRIWSHGFTHLFSLSQILISKKTRYFIGIHPLCAVYNVVNLLLFLEEKRNRGFFDTV